MAKNDNPHALRFLASMEKYGEKEAAEKFSDTNYESIGLYRQNVICLKTD